MASRSSLFFFQGFSPLVHVGTGLGWRFDLIWHQYIFYTRLLTVFLSSTLAVYYFVVSTSGVFSLHGSICVSLSCVDRLARRSYYILDCGCGRREWKGVILRLVRCGVSGEGDPRFRRRQGGW